MPPSEVSLHPHVPSHWPVSAPGLVLAYVGPTMVLLERHAALLGRTTAQFVLVTPEERFLKSGPADALPYAGTDRQIERAPGEADAIYRARLLAAFETWRLAGTNKGILTALAVIGYTKARIFDSHVWFPSDPRWWRFWLVIEPPHAFTSWKLGDGTKLGTKLLGLDGAEAKAALDLLRRVVRKWKAAHTVCVKLILVLFGKLLGTGWKVGDGTKLGAKAVYLDI